MACYLSCPNQSAYPKLDLDETSEMTHSEKPIDAKLKLIPKVTEALMSVFSDIVQGFGKKASR
jgi:hypothetical protein